MLTAVYMATVAMAVFMPTIAEETNWTRAQMGSTISAMTVSMSVSTMTIGRLCDRFGPRIVILPLVIASALALMSLALPDVSFPLFFAKCVLIGLSSPGAVYYSKLLSLWFFERRGFAMSMIGLGTALVYVIGPIASAWLLGMVGWRFAFLVFGLSILVVAFPVLLLFFREPAASVVAGSDTVAPASDGAPRITAFQAMRSKVYWITFGAHFGGVFASMSFISQGVGLFRDRGVSSQTAVLGLSVIFTGTTIAQVLAGYLLDRFRTPQVIVPTALASLIGVVMMHFGTSTGVILVGAALFGLGCGAENSTMAYFVTRYFGVRNFAVVYGSKLPFLVLASASAPILVGAIFDRNGNYGLAFILIEVALAVAAACFLLLEPYRYFPQGMTAVPSSNSDEVLA